MTKDEIISVFLETASAAASESTATHPEDIATAMSFAIEHAGATIHFLMKKGLVK